MSDSETRDGIVSAPAVGERARPDARPREPIVRTEPLGGSALARALLDDDAVAAWLPRAPRSGAEWTRRAREVANRFAGGEWARVLRPAMSPSGAAATRLERVAASGGIVVTTGQQPGLFGGPIYTWSKALGAAALADALEQATGVATVPVFWAATDDSDYAEAQRTIVAVPGGFEVLELPPAPGDVGDRMLADVPLPPVARLLDGLARGAGAAVHADVLRLARECYASGRTIGGAYVALLRAILEPLGIVVLDAAHEAVGDAMAPLLHDALRRADRVAAALAARDEEIRSRGFEPQVQSVRGLSLVFLRTAGVRERVKIVSASQVASRDASLGPNVLLRPVAESTILPTIAYVAGPGELAYFAQVSAVAAALERVAPIAVARWSCTIVEPHVQRILDRYGLAPEALRDPHAAETALARAEMPAAVRESLDEFRRAVDSLTSGMHDAATPAGGRLLPDAVLEGHRRALLHRIERLERRAVAAMKRRQEMTARDLATARGALHPAGVQQERALNLLPLLARHGPVLLERMRERAGEHARTLVEGGPAMAAAR